jgi:iron(III) transport system ATP-binding protein
MAAAIWQLKDVSLVSGRTARLTEIDLQVQPGVTAVLGASGAGKSSLLSLLAGFERPSSGVIVFAPLAKAGQLPIFWSPQDHGLWPKLTAREHLAAVRPDAPQVDRSVEEWLTLLRLTSVADALPHRLSQGERSRLSLGRALASEAACLVLDEPLAHIDPIHCGSYLELIAEHAKALDGTVIFSTHDPASVLRIADQVICLSETRCVFSGSVNELYCSPPTEETAWLLGPVNWIGENNAGLRSLFGDAVRGCVRPEQVRIVACDELSAENGSEASLTVTQVCQSGCFSAVTVCDASQRQFELLTGVVPDSVGVGQRIRIEVSAFSRERGQSSDS